MLFSKRLMYMCSLGLGFSLMTGCASIVDGTHQSVSVLTPPTTGATCALTNDKGKWFVNKTPGSVTIHQSYRDLSVACQKQGYQNATTNVKSHAKPMIAGNALFGGVVGAGVDAADGAAYKYPNVINVPMRVGK